MIPPAGADARPLAEFRLFAILGAWCEGDVIASTVANARRQGCERVYLVDNDSPDDTVAQATAAGAVLARSFRSERYDEGIRIATMNEVVAEVTTATDAAHVWWLWLDADEFPHGPRGRTLREHLAALDRRFRVVGARCFDHYPQAPPRHVPGRHPLDFQPLCMEFTYPMCPAGHRKHPLQRHDRGAAAIRSGLGFHTVESDEPLLEAPEPVFVHHYPLREEAVTRARLGRLCGAREHGARAQADDEAASHAYLRLGSIDAIYRGDWKAVPPLVAAPGTPSVGLELAPWADQVAAEDVPVARWYGGANPLLSVVICTYRRPDLLRECLARLLAQPRDPARCEILVVDNNPGADEREFVSELAFHHGGLRYLHEPAPGLAHARNRGWREAGGAYVGYVDDDARVEPGWLETALEIAAEGHATAFGGPYRAFYASRRPRWFKDEYESHVQGPERRGLGPTEFLDGTNFFVRRDALAAAGGFDSRLGMAGGRIAYGEETDLLLRIRSRDPDALVLYEPRLGVQHLVAAPKMTLREIVRSAIAAGRSSYHVFPDSRLADWRARGLRAASALLADLLWRTWTRDRRAHPFWQQHFCESTLPRLRELGSAAEHWRSRRRDPTAA